MAMQAIAALPEGPDLDHNRRPPCLLEAAPPDEVEIPLPRWSRRHSARGFFIFIFYISVFYKNIFSIWKFTEIYPGRPGPDRPAAERPGPGRPAAGVYLCNFPNRKYIFVKNRNKKYKNKKTAPDVHVCVLVCERKWRTMPCQG